MGWATVAAGLNFAANTIGLASDLNIDFGQNYVCGAIGSCQNQATEGNRGPDFPPTTAPTTSNTRQLPRCEPNLHVSGYDYFQGLNGWYTSKAPGKPWAVFEHDLYTTNNNRYQIAPDHTRGMWIIGKDLCSRASTIRCIFEANYLDRVVVTSDRPVYDPRYRGLTGTEHYTFGSYQGKLHTSISESDAMLYEQRLMHWQQDHESSNCAKNVDGTPSVSDPNDEDYEESHQFCGPEFNFNNRQYYDNPIFKRILIQYNNISDCEVADGTPVNHGRWEEARRKCKGRRHLKYDNKLDQVLWAVEKPGLPQQFNLMQPKHRMQSVRNNINIDQMERNDFEKHKDDTSSYPPDYTTAWLHGGIPLFNLTSWCYDPNSQCRQDYQVANYPYPMPEPCYPGKYWSILLKEAKDNIVSPTDNKFKNNYKYAKRHLRPGFAKIPGGQMKDNFFDRDRIMDFAYDGRGQFPEYLGINADTAEAQRLHYPYGYMSQGLSDAELFTQYNPSMWTMRSNTRGGGSCANEHDERVQTFKYESKNRRGYVPPQYHVRGRTIVQSQPFCDIYDKQFRTSGGGRRSSQVWCQTYANRELTNAPNYYPDGHRDVAYRSINKLTRNNIARFCEVDDIYSRTGMYVDRDNNTCCGRQIDGYEYNVAVPGNDCNYRVITRYSNADLEQCQRLCTLEDRCMGVSYSNTVQAGQANCYLKEYYFGPVNRFNVYRTCDDAYVSTLGFIFYYKRKGAKCGNNYYKYQSDIPCASTATSQNTFFYCLPIPATTTNDTKRSKVVVGPQIIDGQATSQPLGCWMDPSTKFFYYADKDNDDTGVFPEGYSHSECSGNQQCITHPQGNTFTSISTSYKGTASDNDKFCPIGVQVRIGNVEKVLTPGRYRYHELLRLLGDHASFIAPKVALDNITLYPKCHVTFMDNRGDEDESADQHTLRNTGLTPAFFRSSACIKNTFDVSFNRGYPNFELYVGRDICEESGDFQRDFQELDVVCQYKIEFGSWPEMNVFSSFTRPPGSGTGIQYGAVSVSDDFQDMRVGAEECRGYGFSFFGTRICLSFYAPRKIKRMDVPPYCRVEFRTPDYYFQNIKPVTAPIIFIESTSDENLNNWAPDQMGQLDKHVLRLPYAETFKLNCNIYRETNNNLNYLSAITAWVANQPDQFGYSPAPNFGAPDWSLYSDNANQPWKLVHDFTSPRECVADSQSDHHVNFKQINNQNDNLYNKDFRRGDFVNMGLHGKMNFDNVQNQFLLSNHYFNTLEVGKQQTRGFGYLNLSHSLEASLECKAATDVISRGIFQIEEPPTWHGIFELNFVSEAPPGCVYINRNAALSKGFWYVVPSQSYIDELTAAGKDHEDVQNYRSCTDFYDKNDGICIDFKLADLNIWSLMPNYNEYSQTLNQDIGNTAYFVKGYNISSNSEYYIYKSANDTENSVYTLSSRNNINFNQYPGLGTKTSCLQNGLGISRQYQFHSVERSLNGEHGPYEWYNERYITKEACRLYAENNGLFFLGEPDSFDPLVVPLGCFETNGAIYWNNYGTGKHSPAFITPNFAYKQADIDQVEKELVRPDNGFQQFQGPNLFGTAYDDLCSRTSHQNNIWQLDESRQSFTMQLRRNRNPGLTPSQQEACLQQIRSSGNYKDLTMFNNVGDHAAGDIYTLHPDVSGNNYHHPREFYPHVEFVHHVHGKANSRMNHGGDDNSADNFRFIYAVDSHNWPNARFNWARHKGHKKTIYFNDQYVETGRTWRPYTAQEFWAMQDYWGRNARHAFAIPNENEAGGWERRGNWSETLYPSANTEGWGPFSKRNLDVWTQDWYSLLRNVECGDSPDILPQWAGPNPITRGRIAEFSDSRKDDNGYATFLGFENSQALIDSPAKMFLTSNNQGAIEQSCQNDKTVLIGIPAGRLNADDFARAIYPDGLAIVMFYNGQASGFPSYVGCLNPTGIYQNQDLGHNLKESFSEDLTVHQSVCPANTRIYMNMSASTGLYSITFPEDVKADFLTLNGYMPNGLNKPDFTFTRQLSWATRYRGSSSNAERILSMSTVPASQYIPLHTFLRTRHGEWFCRQTEDDKDLCCLGMVDDPTPPDQAQLDGGNLPRIYRGCCMVPDQYSRSFVDTSFPRHNNRPSNIISYWGEEITKPEMCNFDYIAPHVSPQGIIENVFWSDEIELNLPEAVNESRARNEKISRRAVFRLYPNSLQILDMCRSENYWNEPSALTIPVNDSSIIDLGTQENFLEVNIAANHSAVHYEGGFTTGAEAGSNLSTAFGVNGYSIDQYCLVNENNEPVITPWHIRSSPYRQNVTSKFQRILLQGNGYYGSCSSNFDDIKAIALAHNKIITNIVGVGTGDLPRTTGYGLLSSRQWCRERASRDNETQTRAFEVISNSRTTRGCVQYRSPDGVSFYNYWRYNEHSLASQQSTTWGLIYNNFRCEETKRCHQPSYSLPLYVQTEATHDSLGEVGFDCGTGKMPAYTSAEYIYFTSPTANPAFLTLTPQFTRILDLRRYVNEFNNILNYEIARTGSAANSTEIREYEFDRYLSDIGLTADMIDFFDEYMPLMIAGKCQEILNCDYDPLNRQIPVSGCQRLTFSQEYSYFESTPLLGVSAGNYLGNSRFQRKGWGPYAVSLLQNSNVIQELKLDAEPWDKYPVNLCNSITAFGIITQIATITSRPRCHAAPTHDTDNVLWFFQDTSIGNQDLRAEDVPSTIKSGSSYTFLDQNVWRRNNGELLKRQILRKSLPGLNTGYVLNTNEFNYIFILPDAPIWETQDEFSANIYLIKCAPLYYETMNQDIESVDTDTDWSPEWVIYNHTANKITHTDISNGHFTRPDLPQQALQTTGGHRRVLGLKLAEISSQDTLSKHIQPSVEHKLEQQNSKWRPDRQLCVPENQLCAENVHTKFFLAKDYFAVNDLTDSDTRFNLTQRARADCFLQCEYQDGFDPGKYSCTFDHTTFKCHICPVESNVEPVLNDNYESYNCGQDFVQADAVVPAPVPSPPSPPVVQPGGGGGGTTVVNENVESESSGEGDSDNTGIIIGIVVAVLFILGVLLYVFRDNFRRASASFANFRKKDRVSVQNIQSWGQTIL